MVRIAIVASSSPSTQCLKRIRNTIEVRTLRHSTKGCQSLAAPVAIWMRLLISPDHPSGENAVVSFTVLVSMRCSHGTDTSFLSSLSTFPCEVLKFFLSPFLSQQLNCTRCT